MKLKKILSGFLAAAMAVTTMVTATFNAGAATIDKPDGNETVIATFTLSEGDTIKDEHVLSAQYDSGWASLYNLPDDTFTNENYYVKVTYTTETALTIDGNAMGTIAGWGWDNYSKWPLNVGKFYDTTYGTIKADQELIPASTSTDTAIYCYLPVSDFKKDDHIAGNVQNLLTVPLTVKSVQLVEIADYTVPDLPENEYVFDTASGTAAAGSWGQPANIAVGTGKKITSAVLEGDFIVVVPYESDARPHLVLSAETGNEKPLNWVKISPSFVIDGVAYYLKADVLTKWKAEGGSEKFTEVKKILIACADEGALTVTGVKLYSSVAAAAEYDITITNTTPTYGTVTADKEKAAAGETVTLTATPETGYELDTLTVKETTSGTSVVFDDETDKTFTMPDANVTVTATFKAPLTGITLDRETASVLVGKKITLNATKVPAGTADKTPITWSSGDETIATVNAATGEVTGKAAGQVIIFAECGGFSKNCVVTVTAEEKPCTSVTLDKTTAEVLKGKTVTLKAAAAPEDTTDDITWTTSDSAVATVEGGVVTAVAAGTATITVTCGEQTATCKITVPSDACTSVTLDQTTATVLKGKTVTLKATALPEGTSDTITWTTSDAAVATVEDGVVTGVSRGVAKITVKCGEKTAECTVTVNEEETIAIPADPTKPANQFRSPVAENGKYNENDVFVISAADVAAAKSVTVTVTDGTKTYSEEVDKCYKKVTYKAANGTTDTITAGANFLLAVTVTGIPDGTDVTVTITVNK